jgi:hypothetical protein
VKKLRIILGILLPLAAAGLAVWVRTYWPDMRPAPVISVARTPAQIARGRYLAEHVTGCLGCHSHRDWSRFGGPVAGPLEAGGDCLGKEYGLPGTVCTPNLTPDRAERLSYGRYLTIVAGCRFCHTPTDTHGRPIPGRDFAGGQEFRGPWGTQRTPNLTPHRTGLAATGRDDFVGRFKAFESADVAVPAEQRGRNTVMPWLEYAGMTREDLAAIYDYLRTLPPIANRVEVYPAPVQTAAR